MSHEKDFKPLFVREAERRAGRERKTVEQILDADRQRLHATPYPGPDCLDPDDVQALLATDAAAAADDRREALLSHVEGCDHCATLLMLSEPSTATLDLVLSEARERARPSMAAAAAAPIARAERPYAMVMLDVACTVIPSLLALLWITWRLMHPASSESVPAALPPVALLAGAGVLALGALPLSRLPSIRRSVFRYSLGAFTGGLAMAAAWLIFSNTSALQLFNAETAAFALAKDTAKDQIFDVLETCQATRRFPLVASAKRPLLMHARSLSDGRAVYVAAEDWFPGELVAEVTPESAELRLKDKKQDLLLSRFVVGRVTAIDKGTLAMNSSGTTYTLKMSGARAPAEGSDVIAATDPSGTTMTSFRQLSKPAHQEGEAQAQESSR